MTFQLQESFEVLERTPGVLTALLDGLVETWQTADEGPDTWSPHGVVGHLVFGEETDWVPRARIILEHGPDRPFEPFDRFAQLERFRGWSMTRLLERFATLRGENLDVVRGWRLTEKQLDLQGRHPALGLVTLRQLLATWTVHDLGHIAQISRVMAKRFKDDVGVWQEYLPVLHR